MPSRRGKRILIAGLGNLLLRDDGAGVHAVRELRSSPPAGVRVVEVGTAVLDALHLFEWADRVLAIDAVQAGGPAGSIYSFPDSDGEESRQVSLHELGLLAALRFLGDGKRPSVRILGVEPAVIDYGLDLSPPVRAALPALVQSAREIVLDWQRDPSGGTGPDRVPSP